MDREEFYRLKKVSNKKQRDAAAAEAEKNAMKSNAVDKEESVEDAKATKDLLGDDEAEDVIF